MDSHACASSMQGLSLVYCPGKHQDSLWRSRQVENGVSPGSRCISANLHSQFLGSLEQRRRLAVRRSGHEEKVANHRRAADARAGLPVVSSVPVLGPVLNAIINPVVLFIIYAAGASRFWGGYGRTTYSASAPTKMALTAFWPALFVASAAFRSNFRKAVQ